MLTALSELTQALCLHRKQLDIPSSGRLCNIARVLTNAAVERLRSKSQAVRS
jgi:hypothetical protein